MPVSERTYESLALEDPTHQWELHRGVLREKPAMSFGHNRVLRELGRLFYGQLDPAEFVVSINASRVSHSPETYFILDLFVFPVALTEAYRDRWDALEVYAEPLPLVVEVWSPSTGDYDVDAKIPEYRRRGDVEIWRLHPFDRTLTAWRRQPDGGYVESIVRGGTIRPVALPGVEIDLSAVFG